MVSFHLARPRTNSYTRRDVSEVGLLKLLPILYSVNDNDVDDDDDSDNNINN